MHRWLVEIGATVGVSVLMAAGALAAGRSLAAAPPPASAPSFANQQPGCFEAPVVALDHSGVTGRARLCIVDEGVRPLVDVEGLTPNTAYAALMMYFDRPQVCLKQRCAMDDLLPSTDAGVAARLDAIVADGFRKATFRGDLRDLRLSSKSEVSILVLDRGPVTVGDTRGRARRLLDVQAPAAAMSAARSGVVEHLVVARATFDLP